MRVIVADDEYQVRSALKLLLSQEQNVEIVFDTDNLAGLLEQMGDLCPDVLLIDWDMRLPVMSRPMIQTLRHHSPHVHILAMSGRPESRVQALHAGADAFISKGDPPERLLDLVRNLFDAPLHLANEVSISQKSEQ